MESVRSFVFAPLSSVRSPLVFFAFVCFFVFSGVPFFACLGPCTVLRGFFFGAGTQAFLFYVLNS